MNDGILSVANRYITPDLLRKTAAIVGESPERATAAILAAVPTIVLGLIHEASTVKGANTLLSTIKRHGLEVGAAAGLMSELQSGPETEAYLKKGDELLAEVFGEKLDLISSAFADGTGMSAALSRRVLSLVTPMVMGILGKRAAEHEFRPLFLIRYLEEQGPTLAGMLPPGVAESLELAESEQLAPKVPAPLARSSAMDATMIGPERRNLVGMAVMAVLAAIGLWYVSGYHEGGRPAAAPSSTVEVAQVPQQVVDLAGTLDPGSSAPLPRRFVFDEANFVPGSSDVNPSFELTVSQIAETLKVHPKSVVRIEGYGDAQTAAQVAQRLSHDRAEAIMADLVRQGVPERQLRASGTDASRAIASNDPDEQSRLSRRIDLVVISR